MTEEIIVDGVNVAGCEFAVKPINDNRIKCYCVKALLQITKMQEQPESVKSGLCENNSNCYYKQLIRLEQERDELLEEIKQLHNGRNSEELYTLFGKPIKYWEELEQENEIIAKQYNSLTKQYNSLMAYTKELEAKINEQQSSNIR